jgi:IS5 family transposase
VTDASVHDSQKFDGLVNQVNTSAAAYTDSAYRSAETEVKLRARGLRNRIHQRDPRPRAIKGTVAGPGPGSTPSISTVEEFRRHTLL